MITCLSPCAVDFAENLNSLKYATRVSRKTEKLSRKCNGHSWSIHSGQSWSNLNVTKQLKHTQPALQASYCKKRSVKPLCGMDIGKEWFRFWPTHLVAIYSLLSFSLLQKFRMAAEDQAGDIARNSQNKNTLALQAKIPSTVFQLARALRSSYSDNLSIISTRFITFSGVFLLPIDEAPQFLSKAKTSFVGYHFKSSQAVEPGIT